MIGYSDPKPQPEQSLKVFGKIGKNYFMERGKPFIYCAFSQRERPIDYNLEENDLQNITFDESIEMKKCNLDWGRNHDRLSCFTVFTYKGTDEQLKVGFVPCLSPIYGGTCFRKNAHCFLITMFKALVLTPICLHQWHFRMILIREDTSPYRIRTAGLINTRLLSMDVTKDLE